MLALGLVLAVLPPGAQACRYNVRDVGFVDLETLPYRLYAFVDDPAPASTMRRLEEAEEGAFPDANVRFEAIATRDQPDHPALAHRLAAGAEGDPDRNPTAVLVAPDGPTRPLAIPLDLSAGAASLRDALSAVATSPLRESLVAQVTRAFGTILLIEGTNTAANDQARTTIAASIEQIRGHMKSLPKAIAEPPGMLVLGSGSEAPLRERVLLWTLRQDTRPVAEPRAAILYGRARWIGPVMHGVEITTRNLVGVFSLVGADCECGLDLAWTQGTRLPVRWPEALHAPLARALGFDPENPVVKTEISGIVSRRGSGSPAGTGSRATSVPRSEEPTWASPPAAAADLSAVPRKSAAVPRALSPAPTAPATGPASEGRLFPLGYSVAAFLALAILAFGAGIVWRASRRD